MEGLLELSGLNRKSLIFSPCGTAPEQGPEFVSLDIRQHLLDGVPEDYWTMHAPRVLVDGSLTVWKTKSYLIAWDFRETCHETLVEDTRQLYEGMLESVGDWNIMRIWNWVPDINFWPADGEENYRCFCTGRIRAFESRFGPRYKSRLPAASALGVEDNRLGSVLFATRHPVRHAENPLQVPAYEYPSEYGRDAPGFARGTAVPCPGNLLFFISGTASVRSSDTLHPHDILRQIPVTLENLNMIADQTGLLRSLGDKPFEVLTRVFLRKRAFVGEIRSSLEKHLPWAADSMVFLQADICRGDLDLEIEISARPKGFIFID